MPDNISELREKAWRAFRGWHIFLIRRRNEILQHMEDEEIAAYYASRPDYFHPPRNKDFLPDEIEDTTMTGPASSDDNAATQPDNNSPDHPMPDGTNDTETGLYIDPAFADFDESTFREPADYRPYLTRLQQAGFPLPEPLIPVPLPDDDVAHGMMHAGFYRYMVQPAHDDPSHVVLLLGWSHNFLATGYEDMDPVRVTLMQKQVGLSPVFHRLNGNNTHGDAVWFYELGRVPQADRAFLQNAADVLNRLSDSNNPYDPAICMDNDDLAHIRVPHRVFFYALLWARLHRAVQQFVPAASYIDAFTTEMNRAGAAFYLPYIAGDPMDDSPDNIAPALRNRVDVVDVSAQPS